MLIKITCKREWKINELLIPLTFAKKQNAFVSSVYCQIRESRKKRISKEPGNDDYFKIIIQHPGSSGRPAVGRRFKKDALYQVFLNGTSLTF